MKIAFGPNDYVEMIGSGENGELTEKEFELFNSSVNKFFDERKEKLEQDRLKLEQDRIKLEQETNKITQKNIKEISTRCSEIAKSVCYAVAITSLSNNHDVQGKLTDYLVDGYDPALDGLDLTGPKDEEETKPESKPFAKTPTSSNSLNA